MASSKFYKFNTLSLHAGQEADPKTGSRAASGHAQRLEFLRFLTEDTPKSFKVFKVFFK